MLRSRLGGVLSALAAVTIWAVAPSLVKMGLRQMEASSLLCLRFLISSLLALPWLQGILRKRAQIPAATWGILFVILGANFYLQTVALEAIPVGVYVLIFSLNPIVTLLVLREPMSAGTWATIAVALAGGLVFLDGGGGAPGRLSFVTMLPLFGGMLTWTIYTVLVTRLQRVYGDVEIASLTSCIGLLTSLAIWTLRGARWTPPPLGGAGIVVALGALLPAAFFCYAYALRRARLVAIVGQYIEPVIGVAAAVVLFQEPWTGWQTAGLVLVVASMTKLSMSHKAG